MIYVSRPLVSRDFLIFVGFIFQKRILPLYFLRIRIYNIMRIFQQEKRKRKTKCNFWNSLFVLLKCSAIRKVIYSCHKKSSLTKIQNTKDKIQIYENVTNCGVYISLKPLVRSNPSTREILSNVRTKKISVFSSQTKTKMVHNITKIT